MHGGQQQKKSLRRKLEIVDAQVKQVQTFKHQEKYLTDEVKWNTKIRKNNEIRGTAKYAF